MSEIDDARTLHCGHARARLWARESIERWTSLNYHTGDAHLARAYLDLIDRVLPSLRREHYVSPVHYGNCEIRGGGSGDIRDAVCTCGASAHNAIIDAVTETP